MQTKQPSAASTTPLRRYIITLSGYEPHEIKALTAGAAKYSDYIAYCDAFSRIPYRDYLARISILHMGLAT